MYAFESRTWPNVGRLGGRDQLVAGGEHDDARAGVHERRGVPGVGQQPELRRTQPLTGRHQHLPLVHVLAGGAHVFAWSRALEDAHQVAVDLGVLDRNDRVGSGRDRRAGGDPHRLAAATVASGRRPIIARPTTFSSTGTDVEAPAASAARTAKPSIAEDANSGRSMVGHDVSAEHAPVRLGERQLERRERETFDSRRSRASSTAISPSPESWSCTRPFAMAASLSGRGALQRSSFCVGQLGEVGGNSAPTSSRSSASSTVAFR